MKINSKFIIKLIPIIYIYFLVINFAWGVPAFPGLVELTQPDGSTFKGTQKGDEWFSWIETEDGNIVLRHRENYQFEYARIKLVEGSKVLAPSGIKVMEQQTDRTGKKGISSTSNQDIPIIQKEDLYEMWNQARQKALAPKDN